MTAGGDRVLDLVRGQGYGPAEINLGRLFHPAEYRQLLLGRYGRDSVPGLPGDDPLSRLKSVGVPFDYTDTTFLTTYAD